MNGAVWKLPHGSYDFGVPTVWHRVAQDEAAGTFFIATPFHCAVGTKPHDAV